MAPKTEPITQAKGIKGHLHHLGGLEFMFLLLDK
jgi:hypothetical protein